MHQLIHSLRQNLQQPLPGTKVQYEMAAADRPTVMQAPDHARQAGVMALFFPKNEVWNIAFIERQSSHPDDKHAGQISFPGGSKDDTDKDLIFTALREVEEEIGVPVNDIEVLGEISPLYIPVSNFLVQPVVGFTTEAPTFIPQQSEVKSIIEAPLSHLQNAATRQITNVQVRSFTLKNVPYFNVDNHVIWGATAMILHELLTIIK